MTKITANFTYEELQCKCGCGRMEIPFAEVDRLQRLRDVLGFGLIITSGYRCPEHNAKVSSTGRNGPHTKAAFDIALYGTRAVQAIAEGRKLGFTGFGAKQHGPHPGRYIHLDALPNEQGQPRPWFWTYP